MIGRLAITTSRSARCNGLNLGEYALGFCAEQHTVPLGSEIVEDCTPPPGLEVNKFYKRQCRTASPVTVCGNGVSYRNS